MEIEYLRIPKLPSTKRMTTWVFWRINYGLPAAASELSSTPETNSDIREFKDWKIKYSEVFQESIDTQDHELNQVQQQLTKAVSQNNLLAKELDAAVSKVRKQEEEMDNM